MNSDIEQIVRNGLHAELAELIPDGLTPPHGFTATDTVPNRRQIHQRSYSQRWRMPLLSAAAIALVVLVTVPLLRHGPSSSSSPTDTASSSSAAKSYVLVGPAMTPLLYKRAVTLLTSWDQAAPATPAPTRFDNAQLGPEGPGSSVLIDTVQVVGNVITINFIGVATPKNHDCGWSYTASALVSVRAVVVAVEEDPGVWPGGPIDKVGCAYVGTLETLTISLPQVVGHRPILDVDSGLLVKS